MKLGWKILIIVGIFVVVFTGIWLLTMNIQPENGVEAYKKSLRERGEKLEIGEVLPPVVAPESNGVELVEAAFKLLPPADDSSNQPAAMQIILPGKALIGWQQPDLREFGYMGYTNSWANAMADAESNRPMIELLQQAANYPEIDFQLDYRKGFGVGFMHLMPIRKNAQRLVASLMCDLHAGNVASATTNLCTLLSLAQGWHDERLLVSQLVREALVNMAASATWELLQSTNVTDAELARLQKNWERMEFVHAMENAMVMERAMQEDLLRKARVSNSEFHRLFMDPAGGWASSGDWWQDTQEHFKAARDEFGIATWRSKWSYSDETLTLEYDQIILDALRVVETNQFFLPTYNEMVSRTTKLGLHTPAGGNWLLRVSGMDQFEQIFSRLSYSPNENTMRRVMAVEACQHIVITAIALKRYELRHGKFPEKLSELTPDLLPAVPLDPVDGKPLRYRRNADGSFLLYSVGVDGKDDGGDATASVSGSWNWMSDHARDWVWPQPATQAEIQRYYAAPHK